MCSTTPVFCCVHSTPAINSDQQMVSKLHWFCKKTLCEGIWLKQANIQGKKQNSPNKQGESCAGEGKEVHMDYNRSDRTNGTCPISMKNRRESWRMLKEYC